MTALIVAPLVATATIVNFLLRSYLVRYWPIKGSVGMTTPSLYEVSVVIPCLNEAETLAPVIRKTLAGFQRLGIHGEVIVADNGSSDGSQAIAIAEGARLVPVPERGYGAALHGGISAANAEFVVMGDADDSYDLGAIDEFMTQLRAGADLVMGNRFRGRIMPNAMPWLHQWLGNPVLSWLGRTLFHSTVGDFHCGLRAFRKSAWHAIQLQTSGMEYASEMVIKSVLFDQKIVEVPITLYKDGRSRPPHLRTWRDGWRHLRFMLAYAPNWVFLLPGSLLTIISAVVLFWLMPAARQIGAVTLDINTLVVAAALLLFGVQVVLFGLLAKKYLITTGLVPDSPRFAKINDAITLEYGLITGLVLLGIGIWQIAQVFGVWQAGGFQNLDPATSARQTVLGAVAVILAGQIGFTSLFLSILGLNIRKRS
jgi:glycosyltransferase involved in cell wall biosynthesis